MMVRPAAATPIYARPPSILLESLCHLNCIYSETSQKTKYRSKAFQAQRSFHNRIDLCMTDSLEYGYLSISKR